LGLAQYFLSSRRATRKIETNSGQKQASLQLGSDGLLPGSGRDSLHELIEERDRERSISMGRAVDHAFRNQFTSHRGYAGYAFPKSLRDVSGAMRSGTEVRHRPQIALFRGCQSIEANPEEAGVQLGEGKRSRPPRVGSRYR